MKIYGFQWDIVWEDPLANFTAVHNLLEIDPPAPGSLLVLPEMFSTGFSHDPRITNEPDDGLTREFLTEIARKYNVGVLGGRVCDNKNEALAVGPTGETLVRYAKLKPFRPGGETYAPGRETQSFMWGGAKICPLVCYDLRFPELFRDAMRKDRPDVFIVIASWPEVRISHWLALLKARSIENQAFVIGVNRIGSDPNFSYPGRSVAFNYSGECLVDAESQESAVSLSLSLDRLREYREQLPFLEDLEL